MTETFHSFQPVEQPEDAAAREARHQILATLLGAYADEELPLETASQIDAHLLGCGRCRNELHVQKAVRERLSRSTVPVATSAFQARIRQAVAATPIPIDAIEPAVAPASAPRRNVFKIIMSAIGVIAILAVGGLVFRSRAPQLDPAPLVASSSLPVIRVVLDDYQRVVQGQLPGRARDLETVRLAVPFPVTPLTNPDAHLLAAWTSDLDGEPAAVLAYRWKDQMVMQYIVSEATLFRNPQMRGAFAAERAVVSQRGNEGLLAWPEAAAGSVLVGDLSWSSLVPLTRAHVR